MFQLYQHHDLTRLAETLAVLRAWNTPASPLVADTVIVPNRGTARWLQKELAESESTATNLDLPVPGVFVWRVLRDTRSDQPDSSDYERGRLVWHLYALLPELDVPEVQRYLAAEPRERHRYQLAQQLADVFDQYLIHRRDELARWEAGDEARTPPASWQAPVWRAVVERIGQQHRARLLMEFLELAERGELDVSRLPDPVYAFALADLPADYLRLLYALGRYVDVHFLLPNPSAAYWGDIPSRRIGRVDVEALRAGIARSPDEESEDGDAGWLPSVASRPTDGAEPETGHPLLASLGRGGRDFLRVLYGDEFAAVQEPLGEVLAYEPPGVDSLLHRVQSGVIEGAAEVVDVGGVDADASIQLHACHGPVREMQVLHDRLLDLLARDPGLEPRNILVLVPDIARYAPAVHGVFGAASGGRRIPYSVADRPRLDTHPIAQTFQQLIELPLSRWRASEVLALAGVPAVMRRFGLDESDLELLHQWVAAAGVRWGLDRETREAAGAAGFEQNTWRFGLDRLLLGLAQRDEEALVDGVAPWSDLEGGSATAVGRLWSLVDRLRAWRDALSEATTAGAWQERLNAMAKDLFAIDPDDGEEAAALETVFGATAALEEASRSLSDETLPWEAVREALLGALASGAQRQPLVTGGITFSGLEPLRGVPFDVICMVGMDDGVFPRQDGQREFNLVQQRPRVGDPSVRDGDRMTFLQALMAARRCFYVSSTGRDVADGSELQPSTVVGEFLDFLHGYCFSGWPRADFRAALVTEQPMHPFSPRYFSPEDRRLYTFDDDWRRAAEAQCAERVEHEPFIDGTELPGPDPAEPVELAELQRFFRHPAQWFFRERMRLELEEPDTSLDDEEPRALGGLEKHQLRDRLFRHARASNSTEIDPEPSALERARGDLPPPPLGGSDYADAAAAVNTVLPLYWQWQQDAATEADIDIDLTLDDGTRVLGRVPAVGPEEMRRLRSGPLRMTHVLPWWLAWLAVVASGRDVALRLAGTGDEAASQLTGRIDTDEARRYLTAAIDHYRSGHARALLFEPYLAEHYLDQREKKSRATGELKTPDEALDSTNGWLSNTWQPPHPRRDPWLQPLFGPSPTPLGADANASSFVRVVESVGRPLREHLAEPQEDEPGADS